MEKKLSTFDVLRACFNSVIDVTKKLRDNDKSFDGLEFWEKKLKPLLIQVNDSSFSYELNADMLKKNYVLISGKELTQTGVSANDFSLDEFKGDKLVEESHFLLQQFRVPLKEKTFTRLMQIAYNIGQLSTCLDKLPQHVAEKYKETNLTEMSAYVSTSSNEFSNELCEKIIEITNQISKFVKFVQ